MKVPRKIESLRSKLRKPFLESTNFDTLRKRASPSKKKDVRTLQEELTAAATAVPTCVQRQRVDSNATVRGLPNPLATSEHSSTPRVLRRVDASIANSNVVRPSTSTRSNYPTPSVPQQEAASSVSNYSEDYPEIPDELDTGWIESPPSAMMHDVQMKDVWSRPGNPDSTITIQSVDWEVRRFAPHLRKPIPSPFIGLRPPTIDEDTRWPVDLDIHIATPYTNVWDLHPEHKFAKTFQLRLTSPLFRDTLDASPPSGLYFRVASTTHPRFIVPESTRAYEATYLRTSSHPWRHREDASELKKVKGWRLKPALPSRSSENKRLNGLTWYFDLAWSITPSLFSGVTASSSTTRKFVVQAEIEIDGRLVRSQEKEVYITHLTSRGDMKGLVPFPGRRFVDLYGTQRHGGAR